MATSPQPRLDGPPPAASGVVRRAPEPMPSMQGAGVSSEITANTFPQAVIERAMLIEEGLKSLAQMLPQTMPGIAQIIDTFRALIAGSVQGGGQPQGMAAAGPAIPQAPAGPAQPPMA